MSFMVFSSPGVQVSVNGGTLTNYGPDALYYRDEPPVSETVRDGTLAQGQSVALAGSPYVVSAGRSTVDIAAAAAGTGGTDLDTSTLVGFCIWDDDAETWTFNGASTLIRPSFAGVLLWMGGGPAADPTPEGLAITLPGDAWFPSEAVD